jgi:hypothetical protein
MEQQQVNTIYCPWRAQLVSQALDNWLSSCSRGMLALRWRRVVKNQPLQSDQQAAEHSNTLSMARAQLVGQVVNEHIMVLLLGWKNWRVLQRYS